MSKSTRVKISLTEEMVLNETVFPQEMDSWRYYRIEYLFPRRSKFEPATFILLPHDLSADVFERFVNDGYAELELKRCSSCGEQKLLCEFYVEIRGDKEYIRPSCKKCWHRQIVEIQKVWKKKPEGFFYNIKHGALERNIEFGLDRKEFVKWWNGQEKICFYCKRTWEEIAKDKSNVRNQGRLGLDRIDNSRGYFLDNIVLACWRCNTIKNDFFTKNEMLQIGDIIRNKSMHVNADKSH